MTFELTLRPRWRHGWTPAAVAILASAGMAAPATAGADGLPPGRLPTSEKTLRALEKELLGSDHAAEHAVERAGRRQAARRARHLARAGIKRPRPRARAAAAGPASEVGAWESSVRSITVDGSATKGMPAIHAAVLPTGKVLWWGYRLEDGVRYKKEALAVLWDPVTEKIRSVPPPIDPATGRPAALYCSGMSLMADGRLLVTGGYLDSRTNPTTGIPEYDGLNHTYTWDPFTEKWQRHEDMNDGRWYPSQILMPDGRTFIIQGLDSDGEGDNSSNFSRELEVFDPSKPLGQEVDRLSRDLTTSEDGDWYPHGYWMPSGRGLIAGPDRENSWLFLPPAPLTFTKVEAANPLRQRIWGAGVLLPLNFDSTHGKAWQLGGSEGKKAFEPNTNTAEAYDEATNRWTAAPSQEIARSHQNAVLLPDGTIAAFGGGYGNRGTNWDSGPEHRQMELYDPETRSWTLGPAQQRDRSYHSTAVLLPDGSVVSAGDDRDKLDPIDTYEIYKPPYFFNGERPVLSSAPASTGFERTIWVGTPDTDIARAVLIAPGATTHGVDMHQRAINLPARRRADGAGYDVDTPRNANIAMPGYYMLFLIDERGRPSHAKWLRIDPTAPPQDPPAPPVQDPPPPVEDPPPPVEDPPPPVQDPPPPVQDTPPPVEDPAPPPGPTPPLTPAPIAPDPVTPPRTPAPARPADVVSLRTTSLRDALASSRIRLSFLLPTRGTASARITLAPVRRTGRLLDRVVGRWTHTMRVVRAGRTTFTLPLTATMRRHLRGRSGAAVTVRLTTTDLTGRRQVTVTRVRLRR